MDEVQIVEVTPGSVDDAVAVIRSAFATIAADFGLNEENCPKHPAFITRDRLEKLRARGVRLFLLLAEGMPVGHVAVEQESETVFWLEKLAVVPDQRHRGWGGRLVSHVLDYARNRNGARVRLELVDHHEQLKQWYTGMGFVQTDRLAFAHLPFRVARMELSLQPAPTPSPQA